MVLFYFTTLFLVNIIHSQVVFEKSVCNTDSCINLNPPPNFHIPCKSAYCELECSTANANNHIYDIDDYDILHPNETTIYTINCIPENSCSNLTVVSNSGETQINCNTPDSCINSNFVCNPSSQLNTLSIIDTQCNLDCTMQSCQHVNYLCTGYISTCTAQCNDIESCNSLDMICDQHITTNTNSMQCDLSCGTSCDAQSKFSCTKSSDAQCECNGNCNALLKYGVNTISPTMQPTHSELLMPASLLLCWRLQHVHYQQAEEKFVYYLRLMLLYVMMMKINTMSLSIILRSVGNIPWQRGCNKLSVLSPNQRNHQMMQRSITFIDRISENNMLSLFFIPRKATSIAKNRLPEFEPFLIFVNTNSVALIRVGRTVMVFILYKYTFM